MSDTWLGLAIKRYLDERGTTQIFLSKQTRMAREITEDPRTTRSHTKKEAI